MTRASVILCLAAILGGAALVAAGNASGLVPTYVVSLIG